MPYLDHAATTPMLPEAIDAVAAAMAEVGNASSLHADGRRARRVVEEARESIAADLGAQPSDIVFTASGTESNNLVVKGLHRRARAEGRPGRIVTSVVEHHALLDPVEWLRTVEGAPVDLIPVDHHGRVEVAALKEALDDEPAGIAVVSIMWANNEVGTVQPVHEIASLCLERGVTFHSDAVQAVGHLDVDASLPGLDALSLSAHKFGGPGGVGALVLGRQLEPEPLLHGGGQERDLRSGTLDVAGVSGMAAALRAAMADRAERTARVEALRRRLVDVVLHAVPDAVLNGDPVLTSEHRLPGNAHFSFPGCEGDALLMLLDARGISCSTGSACSAGIAQPSHVLLAMGADDVTARSSLRFSLGHSSTEADVDAVGAALSSAVARARAAGRASGRG